MQWLALRDEGQARENFEHDQRTRPVEEKVVLDNKPYYHSFQFGLSASHVKKMYIYCVSYVPLALQ